MPTEPPQERWLLECEECEYIFDAQRLNWLDLRCPKCDSREVYDLESIVDEEIFNAE